MTSVQARGLGFDSCPVQKPLGRGFSGYCHVLSPTLPIKVCINAFPLLLSGETPIAIVVSGGSCYVLA